MAEFVKVGEVGQLAPGEMKEVQVGGRSIVLANVEGAYYACGGECTHAQGDLAEGELDGFIVTCPLHGSEFDVRDGSVQEGPAKDPISSYAVQVNGNDILVSVE